MTKLYTSVVKLLTGNSITIVTVSVMPTSKVRYSTGKEVTFETKPYKLHKLEKGPASSTTLTSDDALKMYKQMTVLRRMENSCATLYKEKMIRGFCHLYTGQEAVAVGMRSVFRDVDSVITSYRCHGWTQLMGGSILGILSELTGRHTGISRGKGGSMHMYGRNFYGGNGIVGAQVISLVAGKDNEFQTPAVIYSPNQVPLGAGVAFANKYVGDGGVCFSLYGDGAANQGQLFEAFNMAYLLQLPAVFVCENNKYGMGTSAERSSANTAYYTRGDYIPGLWVDGMDLLTVREATRFAIDYCTSGKGPLMLEMETYRYYGHSMSDPGTTYRSREEVQEVRKSRDPINSFKDIIIGNEFATADQIKAIDTKVRKEVDAIMKQAKTEAEPGTEELAADIYINCMEPVIRGIHPGAVLKHSNIAVRK